MFNRTFEKEGLDCRYVSFEIPYEQLRAAVEAARLLGFAGLNITSPHKVAIVSLLDKVSIEAEEIGSVNTVVRSAKGLEGYNTDGEGAMRALRVHGFELRGSKVLVIGAGGAARSVVHSFSSEADEIIILNRTLERARAIADKTKGVAKTFASSLSRREFETNFRRAGLIVNATPVQTSRLVEIFGIPGAALSDGPWIFDLAYDSEQKGKLRARSIHPLELLVQQAALSYELWFGRAAPIELMRSALVEHNEADWK
jgi:shikimate dehydrogenase